MLKKIFAFVCGLVPFGAGAASIEPVSVTSPSTTTISVSDAEVKFASGDLLQVYGAGLTNGVAMDVTGDMRVFQTAEPQPSGGTFFVDTTSDTFSLQVAGDVTIGDVLTIGDGNINSSSDKTFNIQNYVGASDVDVKIGTVQNTAIFNVVGVNSFTSGDIDTNGSLSIATTNGITVGALSQITGDVTLDAGGALSVYKLLNVGTVANTVTLAGDTISVANTIQNVAGTMDITATKNLTVSGNLENAGTSMAINAAGGDVLVNGTMNNTAGQMTINAASLTVNGDASAPSFVNNANLIITVSGQTKFTNGFNLAMGAESYGNVFSLTTGGLVLGGDAAAFFANDLNSYDVTIKSAFQTGDVLNGQTNVLADMYLAAAGLTVEDVTNFAGNLKLEGILAGDLTTQSVTGYAGTSTTLSAGNLVNVTGAVSSAGNMTIQGAQVQTSDITNDGGVLNVATTGTGLVKVIGDVYNKSGTLYVDGGQISILGNVINDTGMVTITDSDANTDAVELGGIKVNDGVVNINALGKVEIAQSQSGSDVLGTGTLNVAGGSLNFGAGTYSVTVDGPADNSGYVVNIADDVLVQTPSGTVGDGDVYIAASSPMGFTLNANGKIKIGGDIVNKLVDNNSRALTLAAASAYIAGDVEVYGEKNSVVFQGYPDGGTIIPVTGLQVVGNLNVSNGGNIEIHSLGATVGGLTENGGAIYVYGDGVNVGTLDVASGFSIDNGIIFNDSNTTTTGLIISDMPEFTLSAAAGQDMTVAGGIDLMKNATLTLDSGKDIGLSGAIDTNGTLNINAVQNITAQNDITVGGALNIDATNISLGDVTNSGAVDLVSNTNVGLGIIKNVTPISGTDVSFDVAANGMVVVDAIESAVGTIDINAAQLKVENSADITGGNVSLNASGGANFVGNVSVSGVMGQGNGKTAMLNVVANNSVFSAQNLTIGGFVADANTVSYDIGQDVAVNGDMTVGTSVSSATVNFSAKTFDNTSLDIANLYIFRNYGTFSLNDSYQAYFDDVVNLGNLTINATNGITMAGVQNDGRLILDSGAGVIAVNTLETNGGTIELAGVGLDVVNGLTTSGKLYQNYAGVVSDGGININENDYSLTAANVTVGGITQKTGSLDIFSEDVVVNGDINATDLTISAAELDVLVKGNVSGGTKIFGLDSMEITGDYVFDKFSQLLVNLSDSSLNNYWSSVSLDNGSTLGQITNATGGAALIQVGGKFTSGVRYDDGFTLNSTEVALKDGQIGLSLQDVSNISNETAIWLLAAEDGLGEFSSLEKIRNLNVLFCNASNGVCVTMNNDNLGAYITIRDTDASGTADSLYVVFDPRFGGPVLIEDNRIQPIVARQPGHSAGEYVAAGALDNLIAGQLLNTGFFKKSPIEVIPAIFSGTNVETLMNELYSRMEYYAETAIGSPFVPFSRLVQPREIEQIAGAIAMNEHTSFRDFEDRMFDEFIWNRNRSLQKAWGDFDFGMFSQNVADDKRVYGNRFSVAGGFDWQESDTLILGLTGRISHMSSDNSDDMDLGYIPGQSVSGNVSVDVADTNVGLGAYLIKTLGQELRLYGNVFADLHLIDTTRHQTFVDTIDGFGTAFSLMSEWGLMHDWLNQYIVGNVYVRTGYNFGFDVTEKAAGENYMDMESDGYFMLTPGYSLTAQKRIYPSEWFQIRPYATIGVEYDVLGAPDYAKYKFAAANKFSEYDIEIDALWANIGGGFEFLSAGGVQVGLDYRYQYNNDMQLHNIKVSGSYRF